MLDTKFSEDELTKMCQILRAHGTDCKTLVDMLREADDADAVASRGTFKRVRLLKEFGILKDRDILCHVCMLEVIQNHSDTCEEYKERLESESLFCCPDEHFDYSKCEAAVWMANREKIHRMQEKAARKSFEEGRVEDVHMTRGDSIVENSVEVVGYGPDKPIFTHDARSRWLEKMFPDIDEEIRFNLWQGFLCDKHVGSMKEFSDKITGYKS